MKKTFESCKAALINNQEDQLKACISRRVDSYINELKSGAKIITPIKSAETSDYPSVDLLLRTALQKKVPADLQSQLTFSLLMQRILVKRLLNPQEIKALDLGHVSVNGDHASAELYYDGTLTAMRLPFVLEDKDWKIDILAVRPCGEILMRLDRTLKGETQGEQVELLVRQLPSL